MFLTHPNDTALTAGATRRGFLRTGTMAAFSAGFWLGGDAIAFGQEPTRIAAASRPRQSETKLTRSLFSPYLTQFFLVTTNGESVDLQLQEIADLKNVSSMRLVLHRQDSPALKAKFQEESFSLLFGSSSESLLHQGTWKVSHPTLGTMELFLVPVSRPNGAWHYYEAVFNRLLQS